MGTPKQGKRFSTVCFLSENHSNRDCDSQLDAPFNRGLAWYRYKGLEEEFISASKYFPFQKKYKDTWSEFFADLLTKIGSSIDSFFQIITQPIILEHKKEAKLIKTNFFKIIHFLSYNL